MPKRILQGVVVSDKNDKTIVVLVERRLRHPKKKTVRLSKKYHAHDEKNEAKAGDIVRIEETRSQGPSRSVGPSSRRSPRVRLKENSGLFDGPRE